MGDFIDPRERFRRLKVVQSPTHKFNVGAPVAFKAGSSKAIGSFRVTRQLPEGGHGLQYRIRSDRDGHERVASEHTLERAS
jgi:hypothetical protein